MVLQPPSFLGYKRGVFWSLKWRSKRIKSHEKKKKKKRKKEEDIVKKKIKSCLEWVTNICLNQEKKQKLVTIVSWNYITQLDGGVELIENTPPLCILSFDLFIQVLFMIFLNWFDNVLSCFCIYVQVALNASYNMIVCSCC
jgi:hypothetical protein